MKQYFAKYLPVEGEIKPLDYILDVKLNTIVKLSAQATTHKVPQINTLKEDYKKVKLFLCDRDIQEGDEIFDGERFGTASTVEKNEDGYITYVSIKYTPTQEHGWTVPLNEALRVRGEISPDATWVKQDDEFEEAEVKFIAKGNSDIYYKLTYDEFKRKFVGDALTYFIELKGPCGHFH